MDYVSLVVGEHPYHVFVHDIEKHPQSFFSNLKVGEEPLLLDRDGKLFRLVVAFMITGQLADELKPGTQVAVLEALREEARFFGLPALEDECSKALIGEAKLNYSSLDTFLASVREHGRMETTRDIDRKPSKLTKALRWDLAAPFTCKGVASGAILNESLYKSSSASALVLPELLAAASQSAFGRGAETVMDTKVRDSLEIRAEHLNQDTLTALAKNFDISALWPGRTYELRPYKLVIYQPGGHFDQHRDTVRGQGHIGTLVLILNSAYTGGELEITHAGRTEVVTGPYRWVAMYGDCLHKICPVTSGTRVSLIYDIYGQPKGTGASVAGIKRPVAKVDVQPAGLTTTERKQHSVAHLANIDNCLNEAISPAASAEVSDLDFELPEGSPTCSSSEIDEADEEIPDIRETQKPLTGPPPATANIPAVLTKALDVELSKYKKVVICLSHMYPAHQTVPGFLKGNDQVLYDLLKDHYRVQVVYCNINRTIDHYDEDSSEWAEFFVTHGKEQARMSASVKGASNMWPSTFEAKVVIPRGLDEKCMTKYIDYYTGNESQSEEAAYVVAGLLVMRRE